MSGGQDPDDTYEDRLEALFARALETAPEERAALVEKTRRDDPDLASELARLVRAHEATPPEFLERFDAAGAAELLRPDDPTEIGPYQVHGRVAAGGMGEVYLGEDPRLERRVAIKLLPPWSAGDERARRRLYREARAAAALDHPNIQTVYEIGETDEGQPFLAMAYYRGETLRARLSRGPLTIDEVLDIATQIAAGLAVAHAAGVLHRDLKPENLIITPGGVVKIIDFGIARLTRAPASADTTRTGGTPGTIAYMSPEQLEGESDAGSDLWALGVILYEMLAGERPFDGGSVPVVAAAILGAEAEPVDARRPDTPPALTRVVGRCLEKDREARFGSTEALLADLASVRPDVPGRGPVHPDDDRDAGAEVRRGIPWIVGAVATVVIAALLTLFALTDADNRANVPEAASSIAVLPLVPVSPDSALERLGQELAVLVSAGLDGVGEIRTAEALSVLSRSGLDSIATPASRAAFARSLGAGSLVYGTLLRLGDTVRVQAALLEADGGEPIARVEVDARPDDVRGLADSLSLSLLREIWRRGDAPVPSAGAITTRSVPALRSYLRGERALARAQFDVAVREFERAFAEDSTFWYAYWRSLYPRIYDGSSPDPEIMASLAAHVDEFPEPDRLLYESGRAATETERLDALRRLTQRFPHYWPGWYALANQRIHWAPYLGAELEDARAAIERVTRLHPTFAYAWTHLFWIDVLSRDTIAARSRLEAMASFMTPEGIRINPDQMRYHGLVVDLATHGDRFTPEMLAEQAPYVAAAPGPPTPVQYATGLLDMDLPRSQTQLAEAVLALSPRREVEVAQRLGHGLGLAARGAWDSALVSLDRWVEGNESGAVVETADAGLVAYGFATLGALVGEIEPEVARRRRAPAARFVTGTDADGQAELAWLDGLLAFAAADAEALARARDAIPRDRARWADVLDQSLDAYERALSGDRPGAARSLAALELEGAEVQRHHLTSRRHPFLNAAHRLSAAPWLSAAGDTAAAAEILTWSESVLWSAQRFLDLVNRTLHTYALLERARIADGLGRAREAAELYRRFIERYDLGRSALQEEALGALRRLGGEASD